MTHSAVELDYGLAMEAGVGAGGVSDAALEAMQGPFATAHKVLQSRIDTGELGFWQLPSDGEALEDVRRVQAGLPEVADVLLLGIGGSSLGVRAIQQALAGPVEAPGRPGSGRRPRLHLPDNSDPWLLHALLEALDPAQTLVLVISKSGGTVETAAQLLVVRAWLERSLKATEVRKRLLAITDPVDGGLREQADAEGWASLPIPPNVGGRFSVLSAVGLLPAGLMGVDLEALLAGAAAMAEGLGPDLPSNPAGLLASLHVLHHRDLGKHIHVMMPYADRLRPFANWYVQLWAESLGKRIDNTGATVELGPTPLPAVGATDQHAQMQLFMEGPRDKLITFIRVRDPGVDLEIGPSRGPGAYLAGKSLGALLEAEREGTTQALALDGRPSITLSLERVDAHSLGALFFLYEATTAYAGELYDIDAFDQPGVELGKRLAYGLLGREGYEQTATEVRAWQARRPSRYRL